MQSHQHQAPLINLPPLLMPLINRERERALLAERLADSACRLVTLTGPGGSGKTRLAVFAAHQCFRGPAAERFAHGIVFVPLDALAPVEPLADGIATTIARALGLVLDGADAPATQLLRLLRERALLLVLDNLEHLRAGAAFVSELLHLP
jgi:predicted ATPase